MYNRGGAVELGTPWVPAGVGTGGVHPRLHFVQSATSEPTTIRHTKSERKEYKG